MTKLDNIILPLDGDIKAICAKKLKVNVNEISNIVFLRKSVDARKKNDVHFNVSVCVYFNGENIMQEDEIVNKVSKKPTYRPVVCGSGPAGLFAALTLAKYGLDPILIERGSSVEERAKEIENFKLTRKLNTETNVQFGEGGAGCFSDGKLNTGTHDPRGKLVLEEFVKAGAPREILWEAKPHIGTDKLPNAVCGLRKKIISLGGEVRFNTKLTDINIVNNKINSIIVSSSGKPEKIITDTLILACGHSARDIFYLLKEKGANLEQKAFSIGVRCEHPQELINRIQYGNFYNHPKLGSADYKLAVHLPNGRGVYSFCMCPGGYIMAAASEENRLCVNGMSTFLRNGENANSAILCDVKPTDFGSLDVLAGIELQRKWESIAFIAGGSDYSAPAQLMGDFISNKSSCKQGSINPTYPLGVKWGNINDCLPDFVSSSIREALPLFNQKMHGYIFNDAVLTGIETRSSSPVRILRHEDGQSNIVGLFPCGEGAGYAGGILSAAVDGIKQAEQVVKHLCS